MFFCSFIPVLGVFISTTPIVLVALNAGGPSLSLAAVGMVIVIHALEAYLLNPMIYGRHLKLNPVFTLIILYVGYHGFGLWGMLLGVPVARYFVHDVLGVPFKERGDSINVSASMAPPPPPPPPPPYVVTSDETPIVTPGSHNFTAHIGSSGSQVQWQVDDSRTTSIDPDTTFTTSGQVASLNVDSGSYTLTFRVRVGATLWSSQDIPVCTETGENLDSGGGGSTQAVENCPPGDGGGESLLFQPPPVVSRLQWHGSVIGSAGGGAGRMDLLRLQAGPRHLSTDACERSHR